MEELKTEVQRKRITEMLDKLEYNLNEVEKASYASRRRSHEQSKNI